MEPILVAKLLILLSIANGTPIIAKKLCGPRFAQPIDGGRRFSDGRPLLGPSKTIRGAVVSIALTTAGAPLLGMAAATGAVIGGMAMLGDLFSSLIKRRLDFAPSSRVTGLDQIPESLFPLLACRSSLSLRWSDLILCVALFAIGALILSPIFYRVGLRDRPF